MIDTGSDFSGVGAFDQALIRLGIDYKTVFACDINKFARQTYIHNYGEPEYYPENVYDREIPEKSLDIYMTSPPCQAFSLAGKRKGEDDDRGVLFYNSHEFILKNNPRYFIFENVKGLLSDSGGKTFQRWLDFLGGKSVNGNPVIFPLDEAAPYHIYHKVLNAKDYGVPQNRERVFIIGIRDDVDNNFSWPLPVPLTKRLKDVLEDEVDEKYFLSDKMLSYLHSRSANFNNGKVNYKDENDTASCLTKSSSSIDISDNIIKVGNTNPSGNGMNGNVFDANGISPTLSTNKGEGIKVKAKNETVMIGAFRGRNPENTSDRTTGAPMQQTLEINTKGTSNTITSVQKDNVVVMSNKIINPLKDKSNYGRHFEQAVYSDEGITGALKSSEGSGNKAKVILDTKIRRLTPREAFRLMDFPESFSWPVSDSQAYKQAGNSIVVEVLYKIISKLNL